MGPHKVNPVGMRLQVNRTWEHAAGNANTKDLRKSSGLEDVRMQRIHQGKTPKQAGI